MSNGHGPAHGGELGGLPVDPDLAGSGEELAVSGVFAPGPAHRWPRIHWPTVALVALGGFFGGLARYGVVLAWPTPVGRFPWGIFGVNTVGAFILALVVVVTIEILPGRSYLRAVIGTGFCGALTTFSSVVTGADQLVAHGHVGAGVWYVVSSVLAGLAAASFGIVAARSTAAHLAAAGRDRG